MPKNLARSKMMARESSETVEDNGIVSSSEVNKHLVGNVLQEVVVVMIMMDQEGNLTSRLHHVIKVGPGHEAAVVQVEHLAPGLQVVTPVQLGSERNGSSIVPEDGDANATFP